MARISFFILFFSTLLAVAPVAAGEPETFARVGNWRLFGDGPDYLDLGGGVFNVGGSQENFSLMGQLRLGRKFAFIGPLVGVLTTADSSLYGYVGLYGDLAWKRLVLTPQTAVGAYHQGAGKDLGGTLEFRSALTLAWRFAGECRLGLQVAHISNADLHHENPGADEIYLTFGYPF